MNERKEIQRFGNEVDKLIERYRSKHDISYAAVVGVLQMKIHFLCSESLARLKGNTP